jgi:GT2 family glycosyltransferase
MSAKKDHTRSISSQKLCIGIVTFNHDRRTLLHWLRSLDCARKQFLKCEPCFPITVLSIDNGTESYLAQRKTKVISLSPRGNIGYTKAANILMRDAFEEQEASFFLSANPDGFFHPDFLVEIVRFARRFPGSIIEGHQFPEEHPKAYDPVTYDAPWASGCSMLIPKSVFQRIGVFDERFFMYCEDVDYSWRARKAGLSVKHCPRALYAHSVLNRSESPETLAFSRESGARLALKWRHDAFSRRCKDELRTLPEAMRRKSATGGPQPAMSYKFERAPQRGTIADFSNGFTFGRARWS